MLSIFLVRNTCSILKDAAAAATRRPGEEVDTGSLVLGRVIGPQSVGGSKWQLFPPGNRGLVVTEIGSRGRKMIRIICAMGMLVVAI